MSVLTLIQKNALKNYINTTVKHNYIYINNTYINLNLIPQTIVLIEDILYFINTNLPIYNLKYDKQNDFYILHNNKLISKTTNIYNYIKKNNTNNLFLTIIEKNKGGLSSIIIAVFQIAEFFVMLGKSIIWLGKLVWWLIQFLLWMVTDLLNPLNFMSEFFNSLITIVLAVCRIPVDIFMALLTFSINLMGTWMQGFWGWDQSGLTKNDRESEYFKKINKHNNKKCYLTNSNTVPFSVVLGTILCPPIGVFMDMGLTGWLNILVCIFLTLLFYIPGLVYALLVIYS